MFGLRRRSSWQAPDEIYEARDFLNDKLFGGGLSAIPLVITNAPPCPGFCFYYGTWNWGHPQQIAFLDGRFEGGLTMDDLGDLTHEMAHQWVDPIRGHGPDFVRCLRAVGIEHGDDGADYPIDDGTFVYWAGEFLRRHG